MRLTYGEAISPATRQDPRSLILTNLGSKACVLRGYPTVVALDARGPITFPIRHGGDMMVTPHPPNVVRVAAHRSALFVLNKFTCERGTLRAATTVRVGLPGRPASTRLTVAIPYYPVLGYCGKREKLARAESTLTVSPIVATLSAAMAHG